MRSFIMLLAAIVLFCPAHAQNGGIAGLVQDSRLGPLIYAQVAVSAGGVQKSEVLTDYDGRYLVKPLPPGTYQVTVTYKGQKDITQQVIVPVNGLTTVNVNFSSDSGRREITFLLLPPFPAIQPHRGRITARDCPPSVLPRAYRFEVAPPCCAYVAAAAIATGRRRKAEPA